LPLRQALEPYADKIKAAFVFGSVVTIASPYAIWVLKQASDKLPVELDEAPPWTAPPRCNCSGWSMCR
jgi:hypothetical protein